MTQHHRYSSADNQFRERFLAARIPAPEFSHRSHLRLAYIYLCDVAPDAALPRIRDALQTYLDDVGAPPDKYHATLTEAWLRAVWHFMQNMRACDSADAFLRQAKVLLDASIMETHYRPSTLWSDAARKRFVEPDRDPIPRY